MYRDQDLQWYFARLQEVLKRENASMPFLVKLNDHLNGCAFCHRFQLLILGLKSIQDRSLLRL